MEQSGMTTMEFLDLVWGEEDCYVDLPSKAGGHWIPYNIEWPAERSLVRRRVASCLEDGEDIYFSVARFRSRGRRIADVLPTRWLWADLDTVDPVFLDDDALQPTTAWQSSQGRYQCLWQLKHVLDPERQSRLNRALSYAIGADRGGWDLTQVLRPVGTRNFKYQDRDGAEGTEIELLWHDESVVYVPARMVQKIRAVDPMLFGGQERYRAAVKAAAVNVRGLPARARRLLSVDESMVVVGERSSKLWELLCLLAEAGLDQQQVHDLVWPSAWNKHKEVRNGEERLGREIEKALARVADRAPRPKKAKPAVGRGEDEDSEGERSEEAGEDERTGPKASPFVAYADFLSAPMETPRWLVEDIWSSASHGIIGGEPKTSKSTLAMALGMSVATGEAFLGKYGVASTGPVLMIQEENAPWVMQDRLRKVAWMYGLLKEGDVEIGDAPKGSIASHVVRLNFPSEAPFYMLNNYGFDLEDDEDRAMLEEEIRSQGAAMVILDPLYLMVGDRNMDKASEVSPLMQWLMALRYNYNCAVVLVHHWHKSSESSRGRRPGQRLMGSGLLHGWVESGMYCEALEPEVGEGGLSKMRLIVHREFRNVSPRSSLEMSIEMAEPGELGMEVKVWEFNKVDRVLEVLDALDGTDNGDGKGKGVALSALMKELGLDKKAALRSAVAAGCTTSTWKRGKRTYVRVYAPNDTPAGTPQGADDDE